MKVVGLVSFLVICWIAGAGTSNILVFSAMGTYSHRASLLPYMEALVTQGHNVTFLSGIPSKEDSGGGGGGGVVEFNPLKLVMWKKELLKKGFDAYKVRKSGNLLMSWFWLKMVGAQACHTLYRDKEFLRWMKDPMTKVDMVVMNSLANECAYGVAHHFGAKLVAFNTAQMFPWNVESKYGLPDESSSIPDGMLHMTVPLSFYERLVTAVMPLVWKVYREFWYFPHLEGITREGLAILEIPKFSEIEGNTSLYLVNTYWTQEYARSLPPNVVPVGGIGLKKRGKQPLAKNIEDFIGKGQNGFIYCSFGTVVEFTKLDVEVRQAFWNSFRRFPEIQFILKSAEKIDELIPDNVLVEKWLPQMDILRRHSNKYIFFLM